MKRFFSFFLSFALVFSMIPAIPVSAVGFHETPVIEYTDTSAVSSWTSHFASLISSLDVLSDYSSALMWEALDLSLEGVIPGEKDSVREVVSSVSGLNSFWSRALDFVLDRVLPNYAKDSLSLDVGIGFDDARGVYRPYDRKTGLPIVNSIGQFPYYSPEDPGTGEDSSDRTLGGKWVRIDKVNWNRVNILSEYSFYDIGYALRDYGEDNEVDVRYVDGNPTYEYLISRDRYESGIPFVYCDEDGQPYVNRPDPDAWAQEQDNNWIIDDNGNTENGQLIDVDTNTVWFPDGTLNFINNLVYDESQKTYYVDASSSYDIDNNYYYTYNYHYEYHIDYTSITYIGQTAEYDEVYEYYYQLPDGRSSADLTAEELQALNTQIDVLPYIRSADDTSIRALYHFDGDTRDSSYWSHLGNFKWNKGASLTYMDSGAFNGALYLDENEHEFVITLPSAIGLDDFTFQFRYYQSATLTPARDSSVFIGDTEFFRLNGSDLIVDARTVASPMPTGTWNEIAVVRHDYNVYLYLNGLAVYELSSDFYGLYGYDNTITFTFGSDQQTYKYLDELRFVNSALFENGESYTPTSVPHDTNLSLVLPDSQLPVADAYWTFKSSKENLLSQFQYDDFIDFHASRVQVNRSAPSTTYYSGSTHFTNISFDPYEVYNSGAPVLFYNSVLTTFSSDSTGSFLSATPLNVSADGYSLANLAPSFVPACYSPPAAGGNVYSIIPYSMTIPLSTANSSSSQPWTFVKTGTWYTFSMVSEDGEVGSLEFQMPSYINPPRAQKIQQITFNGYRLFFAQTGTNYNSPIVIGIQPTAFNTTNKFVYLELVEGQGTDLSAEYTESLVVMDKDDLNTPSLAVRTDLDITGYQIGGVRPSLPTKGLVWALVEAGRISSLQIYNGQAWEEVDGRIWTGSRWVPYYAYDVLLLKDMWDIVEADPSLNPIYTEAGFWKWLQEAWGEMMKKLDQIAAGSGGSGSGSGETKSFWNRIADAFTTGLATLIETLFDMIALILKTLLSLGTDMLSFLFSFIGETVLGGISDFFSAFTDGSLLDGFQQTDENGNTTTQLPEGVAAVFTDISGMISALPAELLSVLVIGIALLFLLGVIMLIV